MDRKNRDKAHEFEGNDIMELVTRVMEHGDDIIDDELTKGRIRSIYTQLRYGSKRIQEVAEYYNLPIQLIKDIRDGKIFRKITSDL